MAEPRRTPRVDLLAALAVTLGCCLAVHATDSTLVRAIVGLPAILVAPGWLLLNASAVRHTLDAASSLVLAVASSLAVGAIGAVFVDVVGIGVSASSLSTWTALVSIGAFGVAVVRRQQTMIRRDGSQLWPSLAAFVVIGTSVGVALAMEKGAPVTTRVTGSTALAAFADQGHALRISVRSSETRPLWYTLEVGTGPGTAPQTMTFRLAPGQVWTRTLTARPQASAAHISLARQPDLIKPYASVRVRLA